jgi:hypothetical protein
MNKYRIENPNNKDVREYKSCTSNNSIKYIIIIVIISIFISCIGHPKTNFENPEVVEELLNKVLKGDTNAYYEISVDFFLEDKSNEFLYYAMYMANEHNNARAHYDVYDILTRFSSNKVGNLDTITRNLAIYHLRKAEELGCDIDQEDKDYLK